MIQHAQPVGRRRERWVFASLVSGAILLLMSSVACLAFLWQPDTRPRLGRMADLPLGQAVSYELPLSTDSLRFRPITASSSTTMLIYLVRLSSTEVLALSGRDPRNGCPVLWEPPTRYLIDVCHGSTYSVTGEYVRGPSGRDLDRLPLELSRNGEIIVSSLLPTPGATSAPVTELER